MPLTLEKWKLINVDTPDEDSVMTLSKIYFKDLLGGKIIKIYRAEGDSTTVWSGCPKRNSRR